MKSKKKSTKKLKRLFLLFIIVIIIIYFAPKVFYYLSSSEEERALRKLNYNNETIQLIIDNNIDEYLINNNIYSKTLEKALLNNQYEDDLLEEYIYFEYKDYDEYIIYINKLNELGYKRDEIKAIFDKLNKNDIKKIVNCNEKISNITQYINNEYFDIDKLDRYIALKKKYKTYDVNKVISYVNMYLDYEYYTHDINTNVNDNLLVIVNKYYKLSDDYEPSDLVKIDKNHSYGNNTYYVKSIVKQKFDALVKDMEKEGLSIEVKSAYRSYNTQVTLYNDYVKNNGKTAADTFSARPGYSEHQTGLAVDVKTKSGNYSTFVSSSEYKWMIKNAHKYGFILRYPEDKTNITGYGFESWHYRYVGENVANYIYQNDITYDEYYSIFIANKKD
jgi:D-alanyl-D-alanine carboxypeptidase